jgi:hypothetical protein
MSIDVKRILKQKYRESFGLFLVRRLVLKSNLCADDVYVETLRHEEVRLKYYSYT